MSTSMRKIERQIEMEETEKILQRGQYGILSTISEDGFPYGVPISYVYKNKAIYFHCATEGHKLTNIKASSKVSFCVVGETELLPEKFSTKYESAIVFGNASEVFDLEKEEALLEFINKYSKEHLEKGKEYIKKASDKAKVVKISIEQLSGKARR